MLNLAAYKLCADRKAVPAQSLRFLVRLIAVYELRDWRVLDSAQVSEVVSNQIEFARLMGRLVSCGLIEKKSLGVRKINHLDGVFLYRVRPMYLMTTAEVERQSRELAERTARESTLTTAS